MWSSPGPVIDKGLSGTRAYRGQGPIGTGDHRALHMCRRAVGATKILRIHFIRLQYRNQAERILHNALSDATSDSSGLVLVATLGLRGSTSLLPTV